MKKKESERLIPYGRDEMNLVDVPFTLPIKKPQDMKNIPKTIEGKNWVITGSDKYGLPMAYAQDVYVGMMALSREQDFKNSQVYFCQNSLIELIGWNHQAHSYIKLLNSLRQLSGVKIHLNNFYDNILKKQTMLTFGVISNFQIVSEGRGRKSEIQKEFSSSWFRWDDILFKNIQSGWVKLLDIERYKKYRLPTTKRLYRYLDKRFYSQGEIRIDIFLLAYDILGFQGEYQRASELKRALKPCFDELVSDNYILEPEFEIKEYSVDIIFRQSPLAKTGKQQSKGPIIDIIVNADPLRKRLEAFDSPKMNSSQINFCLQSDENRRKTELVLEFMGQRIQNGEKIVNKPAYLYKLVKDGFIKPQIFETKKEQDEKQTKEEELRNAIKEIARKIHTGEIKYFKPREGLRHKIECVYDTDQDAINWSIEYNDDRKVDVVTFLKTWVFESCFE